MDEAQFAALRQDMLQEIAAHAFLAAERTGRNAFDPQVMEVMGKVPRHEFVPLEYRPYAYLNRPLPIGFDKTISQPFIVALMTDLLDLRKDDVVLEVGTGLGYQAAILAELAGKVYTIEVIEELAQRAAQVLDDQGYPNIEIRIGNGARGWPDHAPFDKVIVTAAPDLIPPSLIRQVRPGGRMVIPAGLPDSQQLILVEMGMDGLVTTKEILAVRFSLLEEEEDE